MESDSQILRQARSLLGAHDFEGAIDLLAPIQSPSPDEMFLLASAHFLTAYHEDDKRKSKAAYRKAMKLYPLCYDACSNPQTACRMWAYSARMLMDEHELIRAKEAGLTETGDVQLIIIHCLLKDDQKAPEEEREKLTDEALGLEPNDPNALSAKASFLMHRREWKRAWEYRARAINHYSERQRKHGAFPDLLARTYLLAIVVGMGDSGRAFLEWAQELGAGNAWVLAANGVAGMASRKEQVEKAKELLSGEAEFGDMTFDEWLGEEAIAVEVGDVERGNGATGEREKKAKEYTPDSIEAMGKEMRERLIVGLLAKGLGRAGE